MKKSKELRGLIDEMGETQRGAARLLEVDERTIRYWLAGNPEPPVMAIFAMYYLIQRENDE